MEQQRSEVKTEGSEKRIKAVRSAGKRALNGAIFGAGLMIPVLSGGWLMTKHIRDEADTLINDKLERVEKTGNGWIFTFKKENTDKVVPELQGVNNNSCMLVQTLNGTPVSTTLPPQNNGDKVCEVSRDSQQNAAGSPPQQALSPTTAIAESESVTTLQPQGDAAP